MGPANGLPSPRRLATHTLARDLAERLKGLASISDQSGGRTVLRISGPRARDVLAKGLPIDLDPRGFPLGSAATSTISLMGVQLWQTGDPQSYDIAIFRSVSPELLALAYRLCRRVRLRGHTLVSSPPPVRAGVKAV